MIYVYYYDSHQPSMSPEMARAQVEPILQAGDSLAVIPRPGYPAEVVVLYSE